MALTKARLWNVSVSPAESTDVLFNPTEYGIDRGANYAELAAPGLSTPILQFVRGESQSLNVELFLDGTDNRESVSKAMDKIRKFVTIDEDLHAPPVCQFQWGDETFQGVVTKLNEKFQLFDEDGKVLRARLTLTIKSYQSVEVQLRSDPRSSPDRTRVRVFRQGESLQQIAAESYGNPGLWRLIAAANDIDRPRFVAAGTQLRIPAS